MAGVTASPALWTTKAARRSADSSPISAASAFTAPSSREGAPKGSAAPLDRVVESAAARMPSAAAARPALCLRSSSMPCKSLVCATYQAQPLELSEGMFNIRLNISPSTQP